MFLSVVCIDVWVEEPFISMWLMTAEILSLFCVSATFYELIAQVLFHCCFDMFYISCDYASSLDTYILYDWPLWFVSPCPNMVKWVHRPPFPHLIGSLRVLWFLIDLFDVLLMHYDGLHCSCS